MKVGGKCLLRLAFTSYPITAFANSYMFGTPKETITYYALRGAMGKSPTSTLLCIPPFGGSY